MVTKYNDLSKSETVNIFLYEIDANIFIYCNVCRHCDEVYALQHNLFIEVHYRLLDAYIVLEKQIYLSVSEPVVAYGRKGVIVKQRLWVRSPLEDMNYYLSIFSFLRSGIKPGVEFR